VDRDAAINVLKWLRQQRLEPLDSG
jgi:hypothetical protein